MASPLQAPGRSRFVRSLRHALNGLVHTVVHQPNMRIHVVAGLMVGLVGSGIKLGLAEKVTLLFCVLLVLFAEMLNTAIEQLVDLATQALDERARIAKDVAAAGVLVLAIGTVVIFAAVLVHNSSVIFADPEAIQRQAVLGVPLVFCGGALMNDHPKPWWADVMLGVAGLATWVGTLPHSESQVFSAMTLGLLVLCAAAARERRKGHQK